MNITQIQIKNLRAGDLYIGRDGSQAEVARVAGPTRKNWSHATVYFRHGRATTMNADTVVSCVTKADRKAAEYNGCLFKSSGRRSRGCACAACQEWRNRPTGRPNIYQLQ
jgi:hypothetical protein